MNKLIIEQLKKCRVANIPAFDDNTTEIFINMWGSNKNVSDELLPNHLYIIEVEDYIIKPFDGFDLHNNWNNGIIPKDKVMSCKVTQIMGKMIHVEAVGVNSNDHWSGWLPRKSIKIIKELS